MFYSVMLAFFCVAIACAVRFAAERRERLKQHARRCTVVRRAPPATTPAPALRESASCATEDPAAAGVQELRTPAAGLGASTRHAGHTPWLGSRPPSANGVLFSPTTPFPLPPASGAAAQSSASTSGALLPGAPSLPLPPPPRHAAQESDAFGSGAGCCGGAPRASLDAASPMDMDTEEASPANGHQASGELTATARGEEGHAVHLCDVLAQYHTSSSGAPPAASSFRCVSQTGAKGPRSAADPDPDGGGRDGGGGVSAGGVSAPPPASKRARFLVLERCTPPSPSPPPGSGSGAPAPAAGGFGAPVAPAPATPSLFGGGAPAASPFGAAAPAAPAFGAAAPAAPAFGASASGAASTTFGGSAFANGASATPATTFGFGGAAAGATPAAPAFGAASGGAAAPTFGAGAPPAFGPATTAVPAAGNPFAIGASETAGRSKARTARKPLRKPR
ncbi:hypothetical protein EMIHUDRAFT_230814 [Emiliania huxleyi CCMP1516]|uniref:Uncharacterized protein n=2 Tax=Emiliania huxleyi TaxID=2903 RepID=A0A0D3K9P1_EMIH1|nr:hypothetical protein EMIHUDRAFT_230814 [Emiliania huxleyi CCMP1516]EOD32476.1 hypothetical protein EMIHUDRAFT_230814 [Emiliania huxleyi CCMP1516]|eukprot:XP_005784905.1 hypothetical protein EMIHUDRAFT_230814 [Emiliania huxleyi CCMP1516]